MQQRGDLRAAHRWLGSSLDLRTTLVRQTPHSVQAQRDLAIAHYLLCGLYLDENELARAASACRRSLAIREDLLADDPGNDNFVRGMGIIHRKLGQVQLAGHDTTAALRSFVLAMRHYSAYLQNRAGALNDRRDHARLMLEHAEAGAMSSAPRVRDEARANYRQAVATLDSVGKLVPLTRDDSTRIRRARVVLR